MEVTINANTLIKLAELLTALGVIGSVILWCVKFVQRSRRQHEELKAIRKEQTLICYGCALPEKTDSKNREKAE